MMRALVIFCFLIGYAQAELRNLWDLNRMAYCKLGYTALDYNDYGCWCGFGGSGEPIDGIDECCMHHDKCYDALVENKKCLITPEEYVDPYTFVCNHTSTTSEPKCTTDANTRSCAAGICACDKAVVDCWSKYPKPETKKSCHHKHFTLRELWNVISYPVRKGIELFQ